MYDNIHFGRLFRKQDDGNIINQEEALVQT